MTIRKRLFGIALCLCAVMGALCMSASAVEAHVHPVCGAEHKDVGDHTGDCGDVTWTAWNGTIAYDSSNTAYVYLTDTTSPTSSIKVTGGQTLNLCLNGQELTKSITVEGNATLNICDCKGGGRITLDSGSAIYVTTVSKSNAHTTLNLYGGTIGTDSTFDSGTIKLYNNDANNSQTVAVFNMYGGEVYNGGSGEFAVYASYAYIGTGYYEFNMYGGSITCEKGRGFESRNNKNVAVKITGGTITCGQYGINLSSQNTLTLAGSPKFIDKAYYSGSANIYIPDNVTLTVTDDFAAADNTTISVKKYVDQTTDTVVIATPAAGVTSLSGKARYFVSSEDGYFVECETDGNLYLTACAITGQPTAENYYTVTALGSPDKVAYQWHEAASGPVAVTNMNAAAADNFSYSDEWSPRYSPTNADPVTLDAFTLHMAKDDVLTVRYSGRAYDGGSCGQSCFNGFTLTGNNSTVQGVNGQDGYYTTYTFTAPADGEYVLKATATPGSSTSGGTTHYNLYSCRFSATVTADVPGTALPGQTAAALKTDGLPTGRYICQVTWEGKTVRTTQVVNYTHTQHDWDVGSVTTPAACTTAGVKTYTCDKCGATKTDKIPASGHAFTVLRHDETQHWYACSRCDATDTKAAHSGGTATCIAEAVCKDCSTKYGEKDPGNHTGKKIWVPAETTHEEKWNCCDAIATPQKDHTWNDGVCSKCDYVCQHKGAADDGDCTTAVECPVCGKTLTAANPSHTWGSWTSNDDGTHTRSCTVAGCTKSETANCSGGTATCVAKAKCKDCGAQYGAFGDHDFPQSTWQSDSNNHWRKCTRCDATTQQVAHNGGKATCDDQAHCAVCGHKYGESDPSNHSGTLGAWKSDDSNHWKEYSCCGAHAETAAHTWDAATCTAPKTCSVCKATEGTPLGHDLTGAWQHDNNHHWKKCSRCDAPGTKADHAGGTATCLARAVCETCHEEYGELSTTNHTGTPGDTWKSNGSDHWKEYSCCGVPAETAAHTWDVATCAEPKTCSVCKTTEGEPLGHDVIPHAAQDATCNAVGWDAYETCSRCDYTTYHELAIDPDNHDFAGGAWQHNSDRHWKTCARCGAEGTKGQHNFSQSGGRYECTDCGYFYYPAPPAPAVPVSPKPGYAACAKGESCPLAGYSDLTPGAWYHDGVHHCLETGLMRGVSSEIFRPNGSTTRAQLVTILWRLEGSPAADGQTFSDVPSGVRCAQAIAWAAERGVVTGYSDGRFRPNDPVTREQLVAILYRYARFKGYDVSAGEDTNILSFADAFSVSEYAAGAMQWACASGLVTGAEKTGETYLAPKDTTTRAQIATLIMRFQTAYPGKA